MSLLHAIFRDKEEGSDSTGSDKGKKTVYTNASKQFLIFSPPIVLTLHLKRFQQVEKCFRIYNWKWFINETLLDICKNQKGTCSSTPYYSFSFHEENIVI